MIDEKYILKGKTIPNRVVFQPMEGFDCRYDGSPDELTVTKYLRNAASGAGIIWFEANAVCNEGKTNPRQMRLTGDNLDVFAELTERMREIAEKELHITPLLILQLTHSGRQSFRPMIAYRNPIYEATRPLTDTNIVSNEYLDTLPEHYVRSARLAEKAGFDGVDVKSCHGYLLSELLSAYTREGRYGGTFQNRSQLYVDCISAVKQSVDDSFIIASRLGVSDMVAKPFGFGTDVNNIIDYTESDMLISRIISSGIDLLNITLGNPYYNPHINRPFRHGGYEPPEPPEIGLKRFRDAELHIKEKFPSLPTVGSGLSYYRENLMEMSEELLTSGVCDFVGYGRETLAYPEFYRDFLYGCFDSKKCCVMYLPFIIQTAYAVLFS